MLIPVKTSNSCQIFLTSSMDFEINCHALIDITSRIQEACDNGQYPCGIYVDFKKGFDTVNHNILLEKLAHYGVGGIQKKNWSEVPGCHLLREMSSQ